MGVQKTSLNKGKIKDILQNEYNIKPIDISIINRGTANIFKIVALDKCYILKEFTSKRTEETVTKEIDVINFLQEKNIKVPKYVKTINGSFYTKNEGRIIIVQEFIEGYVAEDNTRNYEETMECASILGKLTKALLDYNKLSDEGILKEQFSKDRLQSGISELEELKEKLQDTNIIDKYKEQIVKDVNYKIEICKKIQEEFDFNIIKKLSMLNSHGDFCTQQQIYNDSQEPTIIDFEKAKRMPIVWEIMRSYCYTDEEVKDGNINVSNLVDYFKTFNEYIKLNEYDLKYASYVYLLQLISSTFGYKEYVKDIEQEELLKFAFFRTNICRDLYDKKEEISKELLRNVRNI